MRTRLVICITSLSHFTRSSSIGERLCGGHHGDDGEDDGGDDDNEDGDNIILAKCGHWRVELPLVLKQNNGEWSSADLLQDN